ncbi:MAG: dipeptidase PepV [Clostridia bacterium]|nr:dipeptidase PepV [Clostridia bacterium]
MFKSKIDEFKNDEINNLLEIMKFQSVSEETENYEAPFGEECKKALEYALNLGNKIGFRTKNIDGYCGYIEFGEGEEMIGIIGHLDVVPAKKEDGWITEPFNPQIINNNIYGRGAIDDKGPVMAALYAMKAVSETCKLNKRVRLILGLNEEKDWKCINHYKLNEEVPTMGFSPDAEFPCIYAEKGIFTAKIQDDLYLGNDVKILEVNCNNNAVNVVPKYASIILEYYTEETKNRFMNLENLQIVLLSKNRIKLEASGVSAHAANPELGDNAITKLLKALPQNEFVNKLDNLGFFEIQSPKYLGGESTIDESGKLTSNIGIIELENNKICLTINYRVPVNTSFDSVKQNMENLKNYLPNLNIELNNANPKLYVSRDSYLVKTLTRIFNEETNFNTEPIAIGGGTYARAFKNCVAFGAIMPGEKETYHQANEYINIDNLLLATNIYARAIYELGK